MQNSDWIGLFKLIPSVQHNTLVITTQGRAEIAIDVILRMEKEYLVIRGRMVGQTEDGRAFFLPYSEIAFININRAVKESDIIEIMGEDPNEHITSMATGNFDDEDSAIIPPPPIPAARGPMSVVPPPPGSGSMTRPPIAGTPALRAQATGSPSAGKSPLPPVPPASDSGKGSILERLRAQRNAMKK